jgi:hypothetical protein
MGEAIKEEALSRRMPPWPAERGFGAYSNDIGLTPREFEFLISWIDGGVPEGTDPAPALIDHADHWTLGMPDVVTSPAMASAVAARSAPAFRRVTIDTGLARDAWIRAIDFKPDARVTRAAFFSVDGGGQYLGGWTPWQSSTELPAGAAFKLPARARIAVDIMYSGGEQPVTDKPQLALYFADAPPPTPVITTAVRAVPDTKTAGRFVAEFKATDAQALVSMRPELPAATRSLEIKLTRPDGFARGPVVGEGRARALADTVCVQETGGASSRLGLGGGRILRRSARGSRAALLRRPQSLSSRSTVMTRLTSALPTRDSFDDDPSRSTVMTRSHPHCRRVTHSMMIRVGVR